MRTYQELDGAAAMGCFTPPGGFPRSCDPRRLAGRRLPPQECSTSGVPSIRPWDSLGVNDWIRDPGIDCGGAGLRAARMRPPFDHHPHPSVDDHRCLGTRLSDVVLRAAREATCR